MRKGTSAPLTPVKLRLLMVMLYITLLFLDYSFPPCFSLLCQENEAMGRLNSLKLSSQRHLKHYSQRCFPRDVEMVDHVTWSCGLGGLLKQFKDSSFQIICHSK